MAAYNFEQFVHLLNQNGKYITAGAVFGGLVLGLGVWAKGNHVFACKEQASVVIMSV